MRKDRLMLSQRGNPPSPPTPLPRWAREAEVVREVGPKPHTTRIFLVSRQKLFKLSMMQKSPRLIELRVLYAVRTNPGAFDSRTSRHQFAFVGTPGNSSARIKKV